MKKLITMTIMVLAVAVAMAQAPEKFSYQAVVRNTSNALVTDAQVSVRVSILQGSASGNAVYVETHTATTNTNGLLTIEIGGGSNPQGTFVDIDWANGPFFLKTETDPNGGSDYTVTSTQQLLSVPYALYAKEAGNVPQSVGELTNDANYITLEQVPAQVNADWNATEGAAQILNKPELFSGDYNDLTNKPTIPTTVGELTNDANYITLADVPAQVNADWNATEGAAQILNKPELFSGDYNDLTNKPTIPTVPTNVSEFNNDAEYVTTTQLNAANYITAADVPAQVSADWNATEGAAQILNKPTDVSAFTNDAGYITGYTETQTLADVTAQGNSAGNRQLKNVSDPTENLDAVNLRTLTSQINSLQDNFQQQMQQMQQQMSQMQEQIDSLQNIVNSLDTNNNTSGGTAVIDEKSCPAAPTVTDHEGNVYATVQIGNQCWMRDNLRTTTSPSTGTYLIPAADANYTYTGKQAFWYNNDSATYAPQNYGLLYNWNAAVDTFNTAYGETSVNTSSSNAVSVTFNGHRRGICPAGWHLPSHAEWSQLTYYVGVNYACGGGYNNAKALASTTWWLNDEYSDDPCYVGYDPSTNNASGFGAVPAGYRYYGFSNPGYYAGFWSSTEDGSDRAYYRHLYYNFADMPCGSHSKHLGFSVRCLRDEGGTDTTQTTPAGEGQPCPGAATVTDYDGNVYNTVQIGDQCWMRENLRVTHYSDGTPILAGGDNDSFTTPYYYNNNSSFPLSERGYIYNWPAAMHGAASSSAVPSGVQGVCPTGWHLPSDAEWTVLEDYVGNIPEYQCGCSKYAKALTSTTGWNVSTNNCAPGNDQSTNNASGFGAVPAGYWLYEFNSAGYKASFWSSTEADSYSAYYYYLNYDSPSGGLDEENNFLGHSVRCLRNEGGTDTTQTTLPTVITGAVSNITETTATCGGEVTVDGGAAVTERGVCWSTLATPTVADAHTSDGTGTGTFTSSITGLNANTTYYVRAYATNSVGTGYGEVVTFTTEAATPAGDGQPCPGAATVTDHEGNVYATVQIGSQCWMRDNLRTTTSPSTGTYLIPAANANSTYTGKQARWYNNDSATYAPMNYGLLYNWNAAVDTFNTAYGETSVNTDYNNVVSVTFNGHRRGICPAGWHLPSDAEWMALTDYVNSQSEYTCGGNSSNIAKALASTEGWYTSTNNCAVGNDPSSNNATGFSAVPAGYCSGSSCGRAGSRAYFWSSTQNTSDYAYRRYLGYLNAFVGRDYANKDDGFSVRCLRDETGGGTALTEPTVTTSAATDVTETSATLNGSISNPDEVAITTQGFEWKATSGGAYVAVNATGETMTYNLTGLTAGTSYTYRAFVTTAEGTSYGETVSFTTLAAGGTAVIDEKSCPAAPTVTDHEGNVYATVQIGDQCWMRDNLRTTTSPSTGTYLIPAAGTDYTYTGKQAFWYYNDSATYAPMNYGLLYNWNAAVDTFNTAYGETSVNTNYNNAVSVTFSGHRRGICPAGWHLPSDAEWTTLTDYVSSQSEYTCGGNSNYIAKALASTEGWNSYSGECYPGDQSVTANNATGFSAVPAGSCDGSSFGFAGYLADFWSSTQNASNGACDRGLYYSDADVYWVGDLKDVGRSVRCLRD